MEEDGWVLVGTGGSHRQYKHPKREETEAQMVEAIRFHLGGLAKDGIPVPESSSSSASFVVLADTVSVDKD